MKPVVLVLEDDPEVSKLLEGALLDEGYSVRTAGTAAEFEKIVEATRIDLFLLDVNLPDGSGLNLVKKIRRTSDVGIIMVTGRADEVDKIVGLEIGADEYIEKPFRIRELRARVNSVFRRTRQHGYSTSGAAAPDAPAEASEAIAFGQWRLYPASRRVVTADDDEVKLTTAEFDLLMALLKNRNRVMTRDQIMNAIKGQDWASYDRVVDGMVSRLRSKFPVDEKVEHFIKTIRGIGYMFSAD